MERHSFLEGVLDFGDDIYSLPEIFLTISRISFNGVSEASCLGGRENMFFIRIP